MGDQVIVFSRQFFNHLVEHHPPPPAQKMGFYELSFLETMFTVPTIIWNTFKIPN